MKKIIALIFGLFVSCNVHAVSNGVFFACPAQTLQRVAEKHFAQSDVRNDVIVKWRDLLKENGGKAMTAQDMWKVCVAGGLDVKSSDGKQKCIAFITELVDAASAYYRVCGVEKGKSGGKEYCVSRIFDAESGDTLVQVQVRQAIALAEEYARVRYKDTIQCLDYVYDEWNDDFIVCKSTKFPKTYYEFKFSDALEMDAHTIQVGVMSGVCRVHKMPAYEKNAGRSNAAWYCNTGEKSHIKIAEICEPVRATAKKFGLTMTVDGFGCKLTAHSNSKLVNEYGAPLDSLVFSANKSQIQIREDSTIDGTIKAYVESQIGANNLNKFWCEQSSHPYWNLTGTPEDVVTCYVNDKRVDFVFDDLAESGLVFGEQTRQGSKQAIDCIVRGGTYSGSKCLHLGKDQCDQLRQANIDSCPECSQIYWNETDGICELPASATANNIQRGIVITGIVTGTVAGAVITVMTAGVGAGAVAVVMIETAGAAIELEAQLAINKIADEFFVESNKCRNAACAERMIGENLQRLANYTNDLTTPEEDAIDKEMARLVSLIPEDAPFFQKLVTEYNGISLAENKKGFFEADSWEPEQVWRAVGITLQLTGIVTSVGKWVWSKGKTVVSVLDDTNDVMRIKLSRSQAKNIIDTMGEIAHIDDLRHAEDLAQRASDARKLWGRAKTAQQTLQTYKNKYGLTGLADDVVLALAKEADLADDLANTTTKLDDVLRQMDNLYMTNKNGQKVLRPGRTRHDVKVLQATADALASQVDDLGRQLTTISKNLDDVFGVGENGTRIITTVTPGTSKVTDALVGSVAKLGILEAKNQTRKQLDSSDPVVSNVNDEKLPSDPIVIDTTKHTNEVITTPIDNNLYDSGTIEPVVVTAVGTKMPELFTDGVKPLSESDLNIQKSLVAPSVPAPAPVIVPVTEPDPNKTPVVEPDPVVVPGPNKTPVVVPDPVVVPGPNKTPVVVPDPNKTPVVVPKYDSGRTVTPHAVSGKKNAAVGAAVAVASVAAVGGLIGGLIVAGDKKDNNSNANVKPVVPDELDRVMGVATGVLGDVNGNEIRLIPMPTTDGTYAPIVNVDGRAVVVVRYNNNNLPYYLDTRTRSWAPLLGIGENGGWFNTYNNPDHTGIPVIDSVRKILNDKITPTVVLRHVAVSNNGIRFPNAAYGAYAIINAMFVNGVVQQNSGFLDPVSSDLYDRNYKMVRDMLK